MNERSFFHDWIYPLLVLPLLIMAFPYLLIDNVEKSRMDSFYNKIEMSKKKPKGSSD